MFALPPGPVWIIQRLPSLLTPIILLYLLRRATSVCLGVILPLWATFPLGILLFPLLLELQIRWSQYKDRKEAEKLGAVISPEFKADSILPFGLGILKENLDALAKNEYFGEEWFKRTERAGYTFMIRQLAETRVFTSEPEYIKAILATQFSNHHKGPVIIHSLSSLLGRGVFSSDDELWKFHRAMTRPFFTKDRISHFDIFDRHAQDAISQLKARLTEGFPVDIQDLASRFTMDSATEFLFGQNVHSLGAGLPYPGSHYYAPTLEHLKLAQEQQQHPANVFTRSFDEAQRRIAFRSRWGVYWPLIEFWRDEVKTKMVVVNKFIMPILERAVRKKKELGTLDEEKKLSGDREVKEGETLLDHLINYTDDQIVLRDETLNILLAGRDTTANTITYAAYLLAEHPKVLEQLRKEVLETVGETRRPTYDDVKNMKYMRAVINETLRLFPAVPFNMRATTTATVWPSKDGERPFYIPANTKTPYSVFLMHRRKDLWGPDAESFDPDRFLDDRQRKYLTPNPFIFLPFNAGPRICLGQQFAYNETSFFLIRLLQQFSSITLVPDAQPPEARPPKEWAVCPGRKGEEKVRIKTYLTMSVLGGLWVKLEEAKNDAV
ncbi:cytochrome P450 [Amanita rubescens]|nr:cytochrome P450 [Amanita rubescens]